VSQIIAFASDFGLEDGFVGVCHAVIKLACADATVVDLSHQIPPFDIRKGAVVAAAGVYQLPDAIHLVVVDPGVGSGRRDLCIVTNGGSRLVGPDNGVLLPATWRAGGIAAAYALDSEKVGDPHPLATFHARDVLAPAAAAVACGVEPDKLGVRVDEDELTAAPFSPCSVDGIYVVGEVLDTDRFGSLRFNIAAEQIEALGLGSERLEISLGHNRLSVPFAKTFSAVSQGEPVALIDSSGWLTLAVNTGDAADRYGVSLGTLVKVRAEWS
jgi:S-adenosylmethionine hydrolase